jgi:hypothetical protein
VQQRCCAGGIITCVYQRMMILPFGGANESAAMSLMGSDIEDLPEYFHASICNTCIATWLLAIQISAVYIAPIVVAAGESESPPELTILTIIFTSIYHCLISYGEICVSGRKLSSTPVRGGPTSLPRDWHLLKA